MKRWALVLLLATALTAAGQDAWARGRASGGRHHHYSHQHFHGHSVSGFVGFSVFAPWYPWPYYGPLPYWYYPPAYGVPPPAGRSYPPGAFGYWYFCPDNKRYYPEVTECPSEWLAVVPRVGSPPPPTDVPRAGSPPPPPTD